MASYLGIDIGASSVRGVLVRSSYRRAVIEAMVELDLSSAPTLVDVLRMLTQSFATDLDGVAAGLDGEQTFVRTVEIPVTAQRQLAEVLPFELEAQLPIEFSEAVYDQIILRRSGESDVIPVLAVLARTDDVRARIELVKEGTGVEPETIVPGGFALTNLIGTTPELGEPGPVAVLSIEERRSELLVLERGEPVFARTVSRGTVGLPEAAPALARDLRQTLGAWRATGGVAPTMLYLAGAGASVTGAEAFLRGELGVPVAALPPPRLEANAGLVPTPRFAKALGLACSLLPRARSLNLRRGQLSYERGFGFLREKIPLLSGLGVVVLVSFFFSTWAEMRALGQERTTLESALSTLSHDVLGEETTDPERAMELLDKGPPGADEDPLPHADGFDVMVQLAQAVPDNLVHDVEELDVARGHAVIHGIVPTIPDAQAIATAMKAYRCFQDVKIVRTNQAVGEDKQKYVLEFDVKCPNEGKDKDKSAGAPSSSSSPAAAGSAGGKP